MANPEHLQILKQGVEVWNTWREQNRSIRPDLADAPLARAELQGVNLVEAELHGADLHSADFGEGNLRGANLTAADLAYSTLYRVNLARADLARAHLINTNLANANLTDAFLNGAHLATTNLAGAHLAGVHLLMAYLLNPNMRGADVSGAYLNETVFSDINLTTVRGLETCIHFGPSILDHRTLARSGPLPLAFLRGCGLPDALIEYLPSLLGEPFQFYSCFISYASKDHAFAERLYADLQNKGVRCWFAPEDMKIGDRIRPCIDETIHIYDKLLLVLSKTSVASQWVEQEVETALARERQQGTTILFPVRIDNTVMTLETGWPALIRNTRNIGDFRRWKTHDVYQKAFDRLLRDLKAADRQPEG
jgi:uncharacterized protein YjbI with pentapeptide repeats